MANKFNTIALGYFNSKGELVAWSSDTFGTPYKYPKTYEDREEMRTRLLNKVKDIKTSVHDRTENFAKFLDEHNQVAGALVRASNESNTKFFAENDIVEGKIVELELVTNYNGRGNDYSPKWDAVVECIDNEKYSY